MAPTEPSSHRERVYWTAEEDQLLKELVEIHGSKRGKDSKWPIVAAALEGRNIKDCRKRFFHSLAPDLKKGRWSKEEDRLLLEGLEKLGPVWFQIAKMIPGRKDDQCAKRWKEVLDPSLSKGLPWSKDEDTLLLSLYESTGPRWQLIARSIPGRTGLCCRNRWRKFKGDELVASELAAMEEKQKKNVGGNAGGTRTLPDGGRGRRSNSTTEEGSAGSSTGTGTKAGEKKRKRTVKEDGASPVDSRRPPQPAPSSLSSLQQQIHEQSQQQQQLQLQQQQHQQQHSMDHQFQPSSSNSQFNFFESLNQDDNSPHSSGSSDYSQPLQTFSHHGEALVPPFGLSLFSPNTHLQNDQSVQSPLQHSPHHHESPMGGINSIGHQPMNEAGGMLYQSGGGGVEVPRARTLSVDPQNASASRVEVVQQRGLPAFDNQLDRFAHLLPPDHHLTGPKSQPSNASSMSGSSTYTPSMSGTSPSTTLDSLATPASESNQGSGQGLAQTPQVSSEPVVLAHHDDSSWMASFLGSLHHPSASLPPSALNSPIFTGAFEAGLFSAPPSPTRHLYQHLLPPPPLNLDALSPLSEEPASTPSSSSYRQPSTPASQLPNGNQQQQQQQQQTSAKCYLPPPQSTVHLSNANHFLSTSSTAERNLQQHQLHQQQQQQLQIQLQQQQLQVQQQAQQQQHQQQLQQQQQQALGRHPSSTSSSSVPPRAQYVPQSSPPPPPRNMRNDAFPLPTTATSGTTPSTPHSIYPMPQTVLPYMTWDPRPMEEQTPQAPMVLVPAVVLAGLLERAGMQSHRS